jgi:hypothetical protein
MALVTAGALLTALHSYADVNSNMTVWTNWNGTAGLTRVSVQFTIPLNEWETGCESTQVVVHWGDGAQSFHNFSVRAATWIVNHQHAVPGTYEIHAEIITECSGSADHYEEVTY